VIVDTIQREIVSQIKFSETTALLYVAGFIPNTRSLVMFQMSTNQRSIDTNIFIYDTSSPKSQPEVFTYSGLIATFNRRFFAIATGIWCLKREYHNGGDETLTFYEFQRSNHTVIEHIQEIDVNDDDVQASYISLLPNGSLCIIHEYDSGIMDTYAYSFMIYHPRYGKIMGSYAAVPDNAVAAASDADDNAAD